MGKQRKNTLRRVRLVCDIVQQHYEPGNYAKSYYKIWRQYVNPVYPMCYHTLLRYISTPTGELKEQATVPPGQLPLFTNKHYETDKTDIATCAGTT